MFLDLTRPAWWPCQVINFPISCNLRMILNYLGGECSDRLIGRLGFRMASKIAVLNNLGSFLLGTHQE